MTHDLHDRIAGSIYGLLVGDAMGCPIEGWSPREIQVAYGVLQTMEEGQRRRRPGGLHSDDGQQAMALCDALLKDPAAPSAVLADLLVELYRAGDKRQHGFGLHRGTGHNFRNTVRALVQGCTPHDAGQPSSGNGVAMMISPLGLYWRDDDQTLCRAVVDVARVKQTDIRGIAAAGAVAWVTARAVERDTLADLPDLDLLAFLHRVEDEAAEATGSDRHLRVFSEAVEHMLLDRRRPRDKVLERIANVANRTAEKHVYPCSGYAVASVVTSLYMALESDSYRQAVVDTINLGGDADTTGAMVGAITGALYGKSAIPAEWYERLHARDCLDDRIEALAEKRTGWAPAMPLVVLETGWTALLDRQEE